MRKYTYRARVKMGKPVVTGTVEAESIYEAHAAVRRLHKLAIEIRVDGLAGRMESRVEPEPEPRVVGSLPRE